MVYVRVERLHRPVGNGWHPDILLVPAANLLAEKIAEITQSKVKDLVCEDHPNSTSTIVVRAVKGKGPTINKSGLCCEKMKDRIQVTVN